MTQKEMYAVKAGGTLIAIQQGANWQYWRLGNTIYTINADGDPKRANVWCTMDELPEQLRTETRIVGKRWEDWDGMQVIRPDMIPNY